MYREENGQVILTMSREDYERLIFRLGMAAGYASKCGGALGEQLRQDLAFMNRLYEGNPHYTPYLVETKKP